MTFTTPGWKSLDQWRGVTLMYRSGQANPRGLVQANVRTPSSSEDPDHWSLILKDDSGAPVTFTNNLTELFFEDSSEWSRLAAQFDATALSSGAYDYTLEVRAWYNGTPESSIDTVRVLIVNEQDSPYGAGWSVPGLQRLKTYANPNPPQQSAGHVVIIEGDGSIAYFEEKSTAGEYFAPAGDFSVLERVSGTFVREYPDGTKVTFTIPTAHNQEVAAFKVEDRFDNDTQYDVDAGNDNRLLSVTDPIGNDIDFSYPTSTTIEIDSPGGTGNTRQIRLTLDASDDLVDIDGPGVSSQLTATYNAEHQMLTRTDRAGETWDFAYDDFDRLASDKMPTIVAGGGSTRPTVAFNSLEEVILPPTGEGTSSNHATPVLTDSVFTSVTDPEGNATSFQLSRLGPPVEIREPLGRTTSFQLEPGGRPVKTILPSGGVVTNTWAGSKLTSTTDSTTLQTIHYAYNSSSPAPFVQIDSIYGDDIPSQRFDWNGPGRGATLDMRSVGPDSAPTITTYVFGLYGRVDTVTDAGGHTTAYAYADSGFRNLDTVKVVGATPAKDRITSYTHDQHGRDLTVENAQGDVTTFEYDELNRIVKVTDPQGNDTQTAWGDLYQDKITDAIGQEYDFATNAVGWVTQRTDPRGKTDTYAYDKNGNVTSWTDRNGTVTTYVYDALSNLISVTSGGQTTTYETDPAGRFAVVDNGVSKDSVFFDQAGRALNHVTTRGAQTFQQNFAWDMAGKRTSVTWAGQSTSIAYSYDDQERLETLTDVDGGLTTLGYNADLQADEIDIAAVPGNQNVSFQYPSTHRTAEVRFGHTSLNDAFELKMTQDNLSRTVEQHRVGVDTTRFFYYDSQGRLDRYEDWELDSSSCTFDPDEGNLCIDENMVFSDSAHYAYDNVGNRLDHGATVSNGNRLDAFDGYTLTWDDAGFLLSKTKTGFTQNFYWNARGQLDSVSTTVGSTTTKSRYRYDGMGRRIETDIDGEMRRYWHDGDDLFVEFDSSWNTVAEYTMYPGTDRLHSVKRGNDIYYFAT
ncbi:MAG: hypothetical protein MJB57_12865, partial [Gemmatimonadetes bacterium]|nr:hypothetical protein [Gemmatimonadota bacterium]